MTNPNKFPEEDVNIQIIGRHLQVTEAMKQYAQSKLSKIERFHNHIMDIHVTMDIQNIDHSVVIIVKFDHLKVKSHAVSTDMYASIDLAVDRLQRQLRRWKGKIQDHSKKKFSSVDVKINVFQKPYNELEEINQEIEAETDFVHEQELIPGHIIDEETIPLKTLRTDEAIMKMELSGDHFLIYRGEEDRKIKVIYRRNDGNYGVVQAE